MQALSDNKFPRYKHFDPLIPIGCLTPNTGRAIHRFFDTSPISPSGRWVAVFRLPFEDRLNRPGEIGQVVVIDLHTGKEKVVAETRGWEFQLGANINWGEDDHTLIFNDVDRQTWTPQLIKLNLSTGSSEKIPGGVYHVSPDGRYGASASLHAMQRTQRGYGVLLPAERVPRNIGAREDDGLFITDLTTGRRRLVFSLAEAVHYMPDLEGANLEDWEIYGFHAKWSPDGERLMFSIRRFPTAGAQRYDLITNHGDQPLSYDVFTLRPDGSAIYNAIPARYWANKGHHTHWCPDGKTLSMNLGGFGDGYRLVRVDYDGNNIGTISDTIPGSGHPSVYPGNRYILTDDYAHGKTAFGDGTIPLRWIDLTSETEKNLARIGARVEPEPDPVLRVDAHPAWSNDWQWVVFNGVIPGDNTRRVFIADMRRFIAEEQADANA